MTVRNPLPPNLSHLAQRDEAIRAEERERCARLIEEMQERITETWTVRSFSSRRSGGADRLAFAAAIRGLK